MWLTNLLLFKSLGIPLGGTAAGLVLILVYVGLLPALMPGNIGPFYFFARLALLPFGIIHDQAFVFAVILHAIVTLPALLGGVIGLLVRPGRQVSLMISVIIPAKDAAKTIGECLQALLHQEGLQFDHDYEVIVVDDGSTDDTAEIAEQYAVRVIRQTNLGPAAARNAGARIARGTLLAFTDADCAPSPTWLRDLTRPFHNPEVVGVKGVYRTRQTGLVARFVQLEYEYKYARMRNQASIDFIDTYSAAYRKEVFIQNGGFDESFRVPSVEDQEFSFRLARKGYQHGV